MIEKTFEEDNEEEIEVEEIDEDIDEGNDEDDSDSEDADEEETEEEFDVEVLEFSLGEEDINELIEKLEQLREMKIPIEFDIDEENQLLINFEEDDEE